jgi:hypothetical protein
VSEHKAAAEQADAELKELRVTSKQHEACVGVAQKELKEATDKCEVLERQSQTQVKKISELTKAGEEARSKMRQHKGELQQVKKIAAGKPYLLQCVFGNGRRLLTQLWRSANVLSDLWKSLANAHAFFVAHGSPPEQKDIWEQFSEADNTPLLNDQLK